MIVHSIELSPREAHAESRLDLLTEEHAAYKARVEEAKAMLAALQTKLLEIALEIEAENRLVPDMRETA